MNACWQRHRMHEDGHSVVAAAVAAGILSIMVVGYLAWATNEYILNKRSHSWTQALHLCEAGVELGLAELNYPYRDNPYNAFLSSGGWQANGANSYIKTVTNFTDSAGRVVGDCEVVVSSISFKYPVITATGTVTAQGKGNPTITRRVNVVTERRSSFHYALVSRLPMTISDNNASTIDSFDSTDPSKSTGGQYDVTKAQPYGNIASTSTNSGAITLKKAGIFGVATTGAGGHIIFNQSTLGPTFDGAQRVNAEGPGETKGWITHDFVKSMPDIILPPGMSTAPDIGVIDGGEILSSGDYRTSWVKNSKGNVLINGQVRIYCIGDVQLSGSSTLTIAPGCSLEMFVGGKVNITGGGVINGNNTALYNSWMGLSTSTDWSMAGNSTWHGTIYAPRAKLQLSGGNGYVGAYVANQMDCSGGVAIHYDEALGPGIGILGYKVVSWQPMVQRNGTWVIETN